MILRRAMRAFLRSRANPVQRWRARVPGAVCALLLAACAPAQDAAFPGPARMQEAPPSVTDNPAKDKVDYSCTGGNQCTIKDVGNCCGEYPACVNVDSPTFPEQVKADCARNGVSGICGFPVLEGCQCVEGRCEGIKAAQPPPIAPSIK